MDTEKKSVARIEYTVEDRRGNPVRKAKEVIVDHPERVDLEIDKLVEKGAFNFDVKYEAAS